MAKMCGNIRCAACTTPAFMIQCGERMKHGKDLDIKDGGNCAKKRGGALLDYSNEVREKWSKLEINKDT